MLKIEVLKHQPRNRPPPSEEQQEGQVKVVCSEEKGQRKPGEANKALRDTEFCILVCIIFLGDRKLFCLCFCDAVETFL